VVREVGRVMEEVVVVCKDRWVRKFSMLLSFETIACSLSLFAATL